MISAGLAATLMPPGSPAITAGAKVAPGVVEECPAEAEDGADSEVVAAALQAERAGDAVDHYAVVAGATVRTSTPPPIRISAVHTDPHTTAREDLFALSRSDLVVLGLDPEEYKNGLSDEEWLRMYIYSALTNGVELKIKFLGKEIEFNEDGLLQNMRIKMYQFLAARGKTLTASERARLFDYTLFLAINDNRSFEETLSEVVEGRHRLQLARKANTGKPWNEVFLNELYTERGRFFRHILRPDQDRYTVLENPGDLAVGSITFVRNFHAVASGVLSPAKLKHWKPNITELQRGIFGYFSYFTSDEETNIFAESFVPSELDLSAIGRDVAAVSQLPNEDVRQARLGEIFYRLGGAVVAAAVHNNLCLRETCKLDERRSLREAFSVLGGLPFNMGMTKRERWAMREMNAFLLAHPGTDIYLVYGGEHQFLYPPNGPRVESLWFGKLSWDVSRRGVLSNYGLIRRWTMARTLNSLVR